MDQNTGTQPEQIEDVSKSTSAYFRAHDMKYVYILVPVFVLLLYGFVNYNWSPYLLFIPVFIIGAIYFREQAKITKEYFEQIAASLGMIYSPTGDVHTLYGRLKESGHSQSMSNVLVGTLNGRASRVFTYTFTIGYGKGSHTYDVLVFETVFANDMPDIIVRGKNSIFDDPMAVDIGEESVQLEGDFNKYFSLRVPKGYETEAYQILTPDIMAYLIDKAQKLSFEFFENRMYIYLNEVELNRAKLEETIAFAEYLNNLFARSSRAVDVSAEEALQASGAPQ